MLGVHLEDPQLNVVMFPLEPTAASNDKAFYFSSSKSLATKYWEITLYAL